MLTKIDICNIALGLLGGNSIKSFDEPTKEAKICKTTFNFSKNKLIAKFPFSFTRKIAKLNKIKIENKKDQINNFKNIYQLPTDMITMIKILESDNINSYIISADKLYSNLDEITILYSSEVVNTALFSPLFSDALAYTLASDMAINITDNFSLASNLGHISEDKFNVAITNDANQINGISFTIN